MAARRKKNSQRTNPDRPARKSTTAAGKKTAKKTAKKTTRKAATRKAGVRKSDATKKSTTNSSPRTKGNSPSRKKKVRAAAKKIEVKSESDSSRPGKQLPMVVLPGSVKCEHVVVMSGDENKYSLLEETLQRADFWLALEEKRFLVDKEISAFRVLIKPDFNAFELNGSTATDPQLVEHLIDLLHDRGFTQVVVAEGRNSFDLYLENRDVQILADLLGYQYVTPAGRDYDVIDLAEDLVAGPYGNDSVLQGTSFPRLWHEADFHVVFAKNKTDDAYAYTLCLDNLVSLLPLRDKDYHYKHRLELEQVTLELLRHTPVEFCIIDAYISNHGNAGSHAERPIKTNTFVAGCNLLLTDYAAALKMGVDPEASPMHALALRETGLPEPYRIDGELTPYDDWTNVNPVMLDSVRLRHAWPELDQLLQPWIQSIDYESFPFKDPVNEKINRILSSYVAGVDDNPSVFWSIVAFNYFAGFANQGLDAVQTMYWKDRIWQKEVSLNISRDAHELGEYETIEAYLVPLERRTHQLPEDDNGLRWTFHDDGSVLFEFSRAIPVDFNDFTSRVDISKSIQYMNDYLGGVIVPLKEDQRGLVTHQLERNLYLPQPNYLVLYLGQNIDVTKLEFIRYGENEQKMFWKTVKSENGSASYDDGSVRFSRMENGETLVNIFGRQQFTLPLFWQVVNLDNYPLLKNLLFEHAYTTFFTNTLANFEAVYEGRDVRIGKAWNPRAGEPDDERRSVPPAEKILALLTQIQEFIEREIPDREQLFSRLFNAYKPEPELVDEDGFAHFKSAAATGPDHSGDQADQSEVQNLFMTANKTAQGFWKELYQAMQKDWGIRHG